jgi:hypothetical protein
MVAAGFDLGSQNPILSRQTFVAHQAFFINSSADVGQQAGPLHFLKLFLIQHVGNH